MTQVPSELIVDILMLLPVISLLRFRRVSKAWCELIDSDDFVKRHLKHSIRFKKNHKLVLHNRESIRSFGLYSLQPLNEHHFPINNKWLVKRSLVGSSNGLLCVYYHDPRALQYSVFVIWNPLTRKHLKFDTPNIYMRTAHIVYGFGYDSVSEDYKVVLLIFNWVWDDDVGVVTVLETFVYSLRSSCWRKTPRFSRGGCYKYDNRCGGVLVCGALHWVAIFFEERSKSFGVVAFDLVTEEWKMITLPDFNPDDKVSVNIVLELGGCLSIMSYHPKVAELCVWVMKDYGVTESWTMLFTISSNIMPFVNWKGMLPLAYSLNGEDVLLMLKSKGFFRYNLENGTVKLVEIIGLYEYSDPIICLESLVSLGGQAESDEIEDEEKIKTRAERRGLDEARGKRGLRHPWIINGGNARSMTDLTYISRLQIHVREE